jgi:threonine synthase
VLLLEFSYVCSDNCILDVQHLLASSIGLFAEPAALAGFLASGHDVPNDATVVSLVTGNGLKDIEAAARAVSVPARAITSIVEIYGVYCRGKRTRNSPLNLKSVPRSYYQALKSLLSFRR